MSIGYAAALDEMRAIFNDYWVANSASADPGSGSVIAVIWEGMDSGAQPRLPEFPHARVYIRHVKDGQITLGSSANGTRRFSRSGIFTVQIFVPNFKGAGLGLSFAENAAIIARDAFEGVGTASGIWFRNTRIQEIGFTDPFYQMNVVTEFQYDEVR